MADRTFALSEPYHPREIAFRGLWQPAGWDFKCYRIHHRDRPAPDDSLFRAALAYAEKLLGQVQATPDTYGVGFVILHAGREGNFLLVDWWGGENMLYQSLGFAPASSPLQFAPAPPHLSFCVWELAVIDFERQAWIEHALARPDGPDLKAYLAQRLRTVV